MAEEELEFARRVAASRNQGMALRALGMAEGGERGIDHLRESAVVLETSPARLEEAAHSAAASAEFLVCEGVGGLLVPLADDYLVRDFALALALPLVVAASPGLGTINHTLLTLEAARSAGLVVACVVLTTWPGEPDQIERSNREAVESLGQVPVQVLAPLRLDDPESWPPLAAAGEE